MARAHFAFRFDPNGAAKPFRALAERHAADLAEGLRDRARKALSRPSAAFREALVALRYDDDWLGRDADEADRNAKCFVVGLMAGCVAVPSLGRPDEMPHHVVIETLLADAGWTAADVAALLRGEPLSGYLRSVGLDGLAPELAGLDDLIGWLSPARAAALRTGLAAVERHVHRENERHATLLARIVPAWGPQAGHLARQAYRRAETMLRAAATPDRALLLALD